MKLKVCIAGATGRVGRTLRAAASGADDLSLHGTLLAIRKVKDRVGLIRGPDKIME